MPQFVTPQVVRTPGELAALPRAAGSRRAVVMTMGALHRGHAALIETARRRIGAEGQLVVTVFVNPLQFGAGEDFERYPRTLDADTRVAGEAGADAVFAPAAETVYPGGEPQVRIAAGPVGERQEGEFRPGHFDGMLTVVAKLLHLTAPDLALYGEKDAQQLTLIRRMVRDLNFPVEVAGVPTVREDDGLALSSRNRYLSSAERGTALALSRALFAARDRLAAEAVLRARALAAPAAPARAQELAKLHEDRASADAYAVSTRALASPASVRAAAQAVLDEAAGYEPALRLDYLALVDPEDFREIGEDHDGEAVLAVAARVGGTRLIDNVRLTFVTAAQETTPPPQPPSAGATEPSGTASSGAAS
jgi:pantoate--beta-alanine ligase